MSPQDPTPMPPGLDPDERELAARLARIGPHGEPSPALDARILAAAHAAVGDQRQDDRSRTGSASQHARWPLRVGIAASVLLAIGLAWQLRPLPESAPLRSEADTASMAAPAAGEAVRERESAPARVVAPATLPAATATLPGADAANAASARAQGTPAAKEIPPKPVPTQPVPLPPPPAPPAPAPAPEAARTAPVIADTIEAKAMQPPPSQPAPAAAAEPASGNAVRQPSKSVQSAATTATSTATPAPAATPQAFPASADQAAPARRRASVDPGTLQSATTHPQAPVATPLHAPPAEAARSTEAAAAADTEDSNAEDSAAFDAPAVAVPPATVASPEVRAAWLARIRELLRQGHTDEARASLREFHQRYPSHALSPDLRALLENPVDPAADASDNSAPADSSTPTPAP